jgi:hypothetical protein
VCSLSGGALRRVPVGGRREVQNLPLGAGDGAQIVFGRRGEGLGTLGALERPRPASARLPAPPGFGDETPCASSMSPREAYRRPSAPC